MVRSQSWVFPIILTAVASLVVGCESRSVWLPKVVAFEYVRPNSTNQLLDSPPPRIHVLRLPVFVQDLPANLIVPNGADVSLTTFLLSFVNLQGGGITAEEARRMGWGSVPEDLLDSEVKVRAAVVKRCPSGAGFYMDSSDAVVMTWRPVAFGEWHVPAPPVKWTLKAQWDALILEVEWRRREGTVASAATEVRRYATNDLHEPLAWGIRHNVFNALAPVSKGCN
jgi:hypothetical protein